MPEGFEPTTPQFKLIIATSNSSPTEAAMQIQQLLVPLALCLLNFPSLIPLHEVICSYSKHCMHL